MSKQKNQDLTLRPYWAVLGARVRVLLQYRAAAAAGFGCQLFWGLIRMMIFQAFYENADTGVPMTCEQVTTYVWLGQAFIMLLPFRVDGELDGLIRTGNVSYELLRPVDFYSFWYARSIANRIAPAALRAAPMLVIATAAGWIRWPGPANLAAFCAAIVAAVLLTSSISMLMMVSMFWTISGRGVNLVMSSALFLLSGMIIPIPLFPEFLKPVLHALPFCGLIDAPFRLFTEHAPAGAVAGLLIHQLAWAAGLIALGRVLLARAVRRLVVQGG